LTVAAPAAKLPPVRSNASIRGIAGLALALLCICALLYPGAAASKPTRAFRCPDMHGEEWDFFMGGKVQKSGNAYLVIRLGVTCDFADHWARQLNTHEHGHLNNRNVFTDPPRGFHCKQEFSDVYREEAKNEPPAGFDVGSAHCNRLVGKGANKHAIGFTWSPRPLAYEPMP
jgi:hypothetical protein